MREEIKNVIRFWLNMGLDGFRLDTVSYLFERERTNCENLPETHAYIKEIRAMIDHQYPNAVLIADANQWPEDLGSYFDTCREFHMAFNFLLIPRLIMALEQEHHSHVVDIMKRLSEIPMACQWTIFLRNHDELNLEMTTDEERDYLFRTYAEDERMRKNMGIRR